MGDASSMLTNTGTRYTFWHAAFAQEQSSRDQRAFALTDVRVELSSVKTSITNPSTARTWGGMALSLSAVSGQVAQALPYHAPSIAFRHLPQTLPELVTPLKRGTLSLSPSSCPPTRSAPSERFAFNHETVEA